jgi:hypothetical protein
MTNERPKRRRRGTSNATGEERVESEEQTTPQPIPIPKQSSVNLNSKSATHVANIVFRRPQAYNFPVVEFECHAARETCHFIRESLLASPEELRPLIRIENQKLETLGPRRKGSLYLFESAAMLDGNPATPISVMSLHIPGDMDMRYFWTLLSPVRLLTEFSRRGLLGPPVHIPYYDNPPARSKTGQVLPSRHHRLFSFTAENFLKATTFPHSPEYHTASLISDVCPSILDPATAHERIESEPDLHVSSHDTSGDGKDLNDDRYILELHEAERALASLVHAYCAEYLLIKRQYFKAFSRDTVLHAEKVRRAAAQHENERRESKPATLDQGQHEAIRPVVRNQRKESKPATHDRNQRTEPRPSTPAMPAKDDDDEDYENSPADTPTSSPRATTRSRARSSSVVVAPPLPAPDQPSRASAAQIGARNRALHVRTKNAHAKAVEAQTGWSFPRSKKLVRGWEVLGFLDEERVLAVLDGGDDGEGSDEE